LASCAAAAGRYAALAEDMESHGQSELAAVFEQLAIEQKALKRAVLSRSAWVGEGAVQAGPAAWAGPEGAGDRDEEAQNPNLSTPYKALAFAVRNTEHAFRFYSYVAATATSDAMCALAEWLAMEELAQAAQLRRRRRQAYHARRAVGGAARSLNPLQVNSLADLLAAATIMERHIFRHLAGAAAAGADLLILVNQVRGHVDYLTHALSACGDPDPSSDWEIENLVEVGTPKMGGDEETRSREIRLGLAESERAFAFYDTVVNTTSNEAVLFEAQRLSQDALQVIFTLRSYKA
jgi:hypothetical protein